MQSVYISPTSSSPLKLERPSDLFLTSPPAHGINCSTRSHFRDRTRARRPHEPQKYVAVCTQFVGVGSGLTPMIARISVCDYRGNQIIDTFVRPTLAVIDYRSAVTGLQPHHLWAAPLFADVQKKVATVFRGRILIGHSIWQHLSLIEIRHPALDTRDLSLFLPFRRSLCGYSIVSLRQLVHHLMRRKIGFGYEHPLEEARAALDLFRSYEEPWEDIIKEGGWPCSLPPSAFIEWYQ